MKKRKIVVWIISLTLLGGVIVGGEIKMHQERIEQQKRQEAREKRERKELNYRIARYLIQNFEFKKPLKSLEFSKKRHFTIWSNEYAVNFTVNNDPDSEMTIYIQNLNKKFTYRNTSLSFDDNILDFRKKLLSDVETNKCIKQLKISSRGKTNND